MQNVKKANEIKIPRSYGKERTFGDVLYNKNTKTVWATLDLGVFDRLSLTLIKNEDGGFDLLKPYTSKNGEEMVVKLGRTFPVKDKEGNIVEGITKGALGLLKQYDAELKKTITSASDALFISTHKLKEHKELGESSLLKIGYIKGRIGVEIDSAEQNHQADEQYSGSEEQDEIPF